MATQNIATRFQILDQQITNLESQLLSLITPVSAGNHTSLPPPQPPVQVPSNNPPPSSEPVKSAPKKAKAANKQPQPAPAAKIDRDTKYPLDLELLGSRYEHDKFMPPNAVCDPQINYENRLTNTDDDITHAFNENEKNMRLLARKLNLNTSVFYRAPPDYYDWTLQKRRDLLGAPSVHYLCKSMLMTNSKCTHDSYDDPKDSKYYVAIVQYSARFHNEKMGWAIRKLHDDPKPSIKRFNFRWVDGETNDRLTGQPRNGVTPLGSHTSLPIVVSHKIAELDHAYMWLGGGEVDLKWRISVKEFIEHFNCIVDDITYDEPVETD